MREDPMDPAAIANEVADMFVAAGTHPAFVFAIRHTGFILTDENQHLFDDEDIAEWDRAIELWFSMHPDAAPLPELP